MPSSLPYTHYACPCTDILTSSTFPSLPSLPSTQPTARSTTTADDPSSSDEDDKTLDPTHPLASHILHPLEHLLFCTDCHQIRCPRCVTEEAVYYYCPNCLMETAGTAVKTETNRCTRSCLQCPVCATALQLQSLAAPDANAHTAAVPKESRNSARDGGPYILSCPYCAWSTLEIGVKFDKGINVSSQLAKLQIPSTAAADERGETLRAENPLKPAAARGDTGKTQFEGLKDFYRTALAESNPNGSVPGLTSSFGLESPSHLSRILTQYGIGGLKKQRQKPMPVRESASGVEGLRPERLGSEDEVIERIRTLGWDETASVSQQTQQIPPPGSKPSAHPPRMLNELRPIPMKLRSRRAKRCKDCHCHVLRPDDKRQSARMKVRLLALNYMPRIVAAPLNAETTKPEALQPAVPQQFLLTCHNPLYDPLKVKLGTPSTVPGAAGSRITILCPQFDIGASADVWDEALSNNTGSAEGTASRGNAEAGKVWKKGRNWTSVVLEVIPGYAGGAALGTDNGGEGKLLEIPIFVEMEYFTDASTTAPPHLVSPDSESSPGWKSAKEEKIPKELEFWVVVGLGRMAAAGAG